jgi:His-Xaa-Ser system radical SAM maturase HxsB
MAYSLFPCTRERYVLNKHSSMRWGRDRNLVTTDHGAWALLDDKEFRLLRTMKVEEDPALFNMLVEKGVIVTERSMEKVVENYRDRFHFLSRGPTLHIIVPTFRCNQKCVYCHSASKPPGIRGYDMDRKTAKSVVDFIFTSPAETLVIEFQGGDCSLNFGIVKYVIEYAKEVAEKNGKEVKFSVVTNLTTMTEEILGFLKDHKVMGLSTSLDGPKEVHDANRKYIDGRGTYDDVVYWIKRIKSEFKYRFNLNALTTVTRFSLPYPGEIVDEFVNLGFDGVWLRFLNNLGFARSAWERIGYTPEEYLKFWRDGLSHVLEVNKKKLFKEVFSWILLAKMLAKRDPMFVDIQSPCGAGIGQLLYDHKGDIYTCDEAKVLGDTFRLGNVRTSTLRDVITHPTVVSMMNVSSKLTTLCDACPYSPYCGICPVDVYMTQGSLVPKLAQNFRCKVFRGMIDTLFRELLFSEPSKKTFLGWIYKPL